MRKTLLTILFAVVAGLTIQAQNNTRRVPFAKGKVYIASSLSGLDLSYGKTQDWHLDLMAKAGYLFTDNWMFTGMMDYDYRREGSNAFNLGAGFRYYIEQNGLYLGMGATYVHNEDLTDDVMPTVQVGYAFFLNGTVTIEPEIYYNQSLKNSDYSGFGLRIGIGVYL